MRNNVVRVSRVLTLWLMFTALGFLGGLGHAAIGGWIYQTEWEFRRVVEVTLVMGAIFILPISLYIERDIEKEEKAGRLAEKVDPPHRPSMRGIWN